MAIADEAVGNDEASALFGGLEGLRGLVVAVSGGSDSTALLLIAARWAKDVKKRLKRAPKLVAVTIDHGLRPESAREAAAVKRFARGLGVPHRTLRWRGKKPKAQRASWPLLKWPNAALRPVPVIPSGAPPGGPNPSGA